MKPGHAATMTALGKTFAEPKEPCRAKTQTIDASQTKAKKALVNSAPQMPANIRPRGVIPSAMTPIVNSQEASLGRSDSNALTGSSVGHSITSARANAR